MRRELENYGIQMPAFSKIGGILANEMPVDEAARKHTTNFPPIFNKCIPSHLTCTFPAVHAAVIAINEAIDHQVAPDTLAALQNPMAHLVNVSEDLDDSYQATLFAAKQHKSEIAQNKVELRKPALDIDFQTLNLLHFVL